MRALIWSVCNRLCVLFIFIELLLVPMLLGATFDSREEMLARYPDMATYVPFYDDSVVIYLTVGCFFAFPLLILSYLCWRWRWGRVLFVVPGITVVLGMMVLWSEYSFARLLQQEYNLGQERQANGVESVAIGNAWDYATGSWQTVSCEINEHHRGEWYFTARNMRFDFLPQFMDGWLDWHDAEEIYMLTVQNELWGDGSAGEVYLADYLDEYYGAAPADIPESMGEGSVYVVQTVSCLPPPGAVDGQWSEGTVEEVTLLQYRVVDEKVAGGKMGINELAVTDAAEKPGLEPLRTLKVRFYVTTKEVGVSAYAVDDWVYLGVEAQPVAQ